MQNIIIVGDSGVGKSSFLLRLKTNEFYESYMSTISKEMHKIDNYIIHDTSGNGRFEYLFENYYKHANGAIVFYSDNVDSVASWIDKLKKANSELPIIIVASKRDIIKDKIPAFEYPCVEISSKDGNINKVMETIIPLLTEVKISPDSWYDYFFPCCVQ